MHARGRTRTGTGANPRDFKSLASTYSATRANKHVTNYLEIITGRNVFYSLWNLIQ